MLSFMSEFISCTYLLLYVLTFANLQYMYEGIWIFKKNLEYIEEQMVGLSIISSCHKTNRIYKKIWANANMLSRERDQISQNSMEEDDELNYKVEFK